MRTLWLSAVLLLVPVVATAQDQRLDGLVAALNQVSAKPTTETAMLDRIARAVALSTDTLRAEQLRAGLPSGDLFIAHLIATRGGHPIEKVFAARWSGASWKLIAEEAQVDGAELEKDLLAAFPNLTPVEVPVTVPRAAPPAAVPPPTPAEKVPASEPPKAAAPAPEKKGGVTGWFRNLFNAGPATESTDDKEDKQQKRQEEIRDFMRGGPRR